MQVHYYMIGLRVVLLVGMISALPYPQISRALPSPLPAGVGRLPPQISGEPSETYGGAGYGAAGILEKKASYGVARPTGQTSVNHGYVQPSSGPPSPGRQGEKERQGGGQGQVLQRGQEVQRGGQRQGEQRGQESDGSNYQTETKYYYGGKYQGNCATDGLYYRDDTTFVICSNGYPHEQPCPPGTKTSGSPKYQAGYYYGYTDLCSVNLVDYGYGPEYYAPKGYPLSDEYNDRKKGGYTTKQRDPEVSKNYPKIDGYNERKKDGYMAATRDYKPVAVAPQSVSEVHKNSRYQDRPQAPETYANDQYVGTKMSNKDISRSYGST